MKCAYPNGVGLTKEQIESIESFVVKVVDAVKNAFNSFVDWLQDLLESDKFKEFLKEQWQMKRIEIKRPPMNIELPSVPMLDKRTHINLIRNNC